MSDTRLALVRLGQELKPCPECGSKDFVVGVSAEFYAIECPKCRTGVQAKDAGTAIRAWNRDGAEHWTPRMRDGEDEE